jgi:lipid-A-disaccharide synthase-like uncharacterized protein
MNLDRLLHVNAWVVFGLLGQVCFSLRFLVQWLASERRKQSTIPVMFWYLSLLGGTALLVYALRYLHDPVFTLGQSMGLLVYARNLMLIKRRAAPGDGAAAQGAPAAGP